MVSVTFVNNWQLVKKTNAQEISYTNLKGLFTRLKADSHLLAFLQQTVIMYLNLKPHSKVLRLR